MTSLPSSLAARTPPGLHVGFVGSLLNRAEPLRRDAEKLARDPKARLLSLHDYHPAIDGGALATLPLPDLPFDQLALIGIQDGAPLFGHIDPTASAARRTTELMSLLASLPASEASTYAAARSLLDWHSRHRFCANCGQATAPVRAGWGRQCPACLAEHFPRTDPVVIMLAEIDDKVLVGRQAVFPPGRYSALAGFVEVGESVEEAVARELVEEAGVRTTSVRYVASQPWPFPSQLMLACIAPVDDPAITIDTDELEDAKWVTRDEVRAALDQAPGAVFLPPPPYAIANSLFEAWLAGA